MTFLSHFKYIFSKWWLLNSFNEFYLYYLSTRGECVRSHSLSVLCSRFMRPYLNATVFERNRIWTQPYLNATIFERNRIWTRPYLNATVFERDRIWTQPYLNATVFERNHIWTQPFLLFIVIPHFFTPTFFTPTFFYPHFFLDFLFSQQFF